MKYFLPLLLTLSACTSGKKSLIRIEAQGSFAVGGAVLQHEGDFDLQKPLLPQGQTFHGDHATVFYQIPHKAKKYPLVFLHGAGQSKRTWETTADGREGFQNLFLRRGFSVYLLDQPRRGEAGKSLAEATIKVVPDEQFWFTQFRLGQFPQYFPGVQFAQDNATLEQFFRQMTPNTGDFDLNIISDAVSALFNRIGEGVLVTHSQGGGAGWITAIKNEKVKGLVAFEPYSGFVFPKGELPAPLSSTGLFGPLHGVEIPPEDFIRLTMIPIVLYYGDNIAATPTSVWNQDHWRAGLDMARRWAETVNKHGGDVTVVHLPERGIYGNTHFPFSDLNNVQIADLLQQWLAQKGLN